MDPDDEATLRELLFVRLGLRPYPDDQGCYPPEPDTRPPRKTRAGTTEQDPLAALEGRHPVIEPLLEYRRLGATRAPFAEREAWESIRAGTINTAVDSLSIRFKSDGPDEGAGPPPPPTSRRPRTRGKRTNG